MRFRSSSGRALGYHTRGAGPVIVLLHPIGLQAAFWEPVAERLDSAFRILSIDLPGHGDSDVPPGPFTLDDAAAAVVELLRAVGQAPAVVGGCSMGGMVAQAIALRASDVVRGLVLANTAHTFSPEGRVGMEQRARAALGGMPAVLRTTLDRWFDPAVQARESELIARVAGWLLHGDPVVHAWSWRAIGGLDHGARLKEIATPTLILTGAHDRSIPASVADAMMGLLPNGRHQDVDAGHLAPIERPDAVADALRQFCADIKT